MSAIADANKKLHKRSCSAAKAGAADSFAGLDANRRLPKRSSSSGKASVRLPAMPCSNRLSLHAALAARRSAPKRFAEGSLTTLKEAFAICQDIEMDAEIQADHMLKYQELKFKSCLPNMSEVLSDAQARMPSKLHKGYQGYVFSGLQELKETSQRKVLQADHADATHVASNSNMGRLIEDQDAVNSLPIEGLPLAKTKERSNSTQSQVERLDRLEITGNHPMFRNRFHLNRNEFSNGANDKQARQLQKVSSPHKVVTLRPPLPSYYNFQ